MKTSHFPRSGFTLIELLIVVAIIAILAAIAVPNFLEAQVRAKTSRSWADLRTIVTGLESYRVDNNAYPIDGQAATDGQSFWYVPGGPVPQSGAGGLTSPVSYLTSVTLLDPFRTMIDATSSWNADGMGDPGVLTNFTPNDYRRYRYRSHRYTYRANLSSNSALSMDALYGSWVVAGSGPNRSIDLAAGAGNPPNPPSIAGQGLNNWTDSHMIYDPTNGTISRGDLVRSQKMSQQAGGNYGPGN